MPLTTSSLPVEILSNIFHYLSDAHHGRKLPKSYALVSQSWFSVWTETQFRKVDDLYMILCVITHGSSETLTISDDAWKSFEEHYAPHVHEIIIQGGWHSSMRSGNTWKLLHFLRSKYASSIATRVIFPQLHTIHIQNLSECNGGLVQIENLFRIMDLVSHPGVHNVVWSDNAYLLQRKHGIEISVSSEGTSLPAIAIETLPGRPSEWLKVLNGALKKTSVGGILFPSLCQVGETQPCSIVRPCTKEQSMLKPESWRPELRTRIVECI